MTKKLNKMEQVRKKSKKRVGDQSITRYLFTKEKDIKEKNVSFKLDDFINREYKNMPSIENIQITPNEEALPVFYESLEKSISILNTQYI